MDQQLYMGMQGTYELSYFGEGGEDLMEGEGGSESGEHGGEWVH